MSNTGRKGRQIIVWLPVELAQAIEVARGDETRTSWIARKLAEAITRPDRPPFAPVESTPAPALSLQGIEHDVQSAPAPDQPERKEHVRW